MRLPSWLGGQPKPPTPTPQAYVADNGDCLRVFFVETLKEARQNTLKPGGGMVYHTPGFLPGVKRLTENLVSASGAAIVTVHRQYIALHWGEMGSRPNGAEKAVINLLASHFGWGDEPVVAHVRYGSAELLDIGRRLGADWSPTS